MKEIRSLLKLALGLLALSLVVSPLTARADDPPAEKKLTKAKEKFDADKDGKLSDAEKTAAKEDAAKSKDARDEKLKKELAKYDANGNGKLDEDEKAKMKSDQEADLLAERTARQADRLHAKADRAAKKGRSK